MPAMFLKCIVSVGQFSNEVAIRGEDHAGVAFSFFVEKRLVDYKDEPQRGRDVNGLLHVEALEQKGDLVLIRLPGRTFENGSTITAKSSQLLRPTATRQTA